MLTYALVLYLIIQQEENLIKQIRETKKKSCALYQNRSPCGFGIGRTPSIDCASDAFSLVRVVHEDHLGFEAFELVILKSSISYDYDEIALLGLVRRSSIDADDP